MKAIILAAGRGSRMKSLTDHQPKCLVKVHGKSLLDCQLDALRESGINEIAIVTGYKRDLLSNRGLVEFHNKRWDETNMVSSLACAEQWLRTGPCIVSYSDIFYKPPAIQSLMACRSLLAIAFDPNWRVLWSRRFADPLLDAETFRVTSDLKVTEIGNKPRSLDQVQGQYMGLLRFTPSGWAEVDRVRAELTPECRDKLHMTGILQKVIEVGVIEVEAIPYLGDWGEVDSAEDLASYE